MLLFLLVFKNYVSSYMNFNFQYNPILLRDYVINLFKYLEKTKRNSEQNVLIAIFTNNQNKDSLKTFSSTSSLSCLKLILLSLYIKN